MPSPRVLFPSLICALLTAGSVLPSSDSNAQAWPQRELPGQLVSVSVQVDGAYAPLYAALDGSERYYVEARQGAQYTVSLANETGQRLGVSLRVDGLDAISGERRDRSFWKRDTPGRMYVLGPWGRATVRGWRTSLEEVRRFTFVDERSSYAARSGKANAKMGWIEILVYRERERPALSRAPELGRILPLPEGAAESPSEGRQGPAAVPAPSPPSGDPASGREEADAEAGYGRSYPGTGWGPSAADPVLLVDFHPETEPAERITLRYEYRDTLIALGVVSPWRDADRLAEREWGGEGFARPPRR